MGYVGGIDGKVELALALDQLGESSEIARLAPRGTGLTGFLSRGIASEHADGEVDGPYWWLTVELLELLGIWWPEGAVKQLPVMTPWAIRDRSARYDQGPENWSAPREDGYLRDDNSIIKKLPLPLYVTHPGHGPYDGRRPWRGFTACHIWRETVDLGLGGTDPWIYSFMPNLVWLPSPLAGLTDYNRSVQSLIQQTSVELFRGIIDSPAQGRIDYAWSRLVVEFDESAKPARQIDPDLVATFVVTPDFFARRLRSIDEFSNGANEVIKDGSTKKKLFSSRYTAGIREISPHALEAFRDALTGYADEVRRGLRTS